MFEIGKLAEFFGGGESPEPPCVRCGACLAACPANLSPLRLHALWRDSETERMAGEESLDACVLCGKCDAVCPSGLPLAESFAAAREIVEKRRQERARAEKLRIRHQNHLRRAAAPKPRAKLNPAALAALARKRAEEKTRENPHNPV